MKYMFSNYGEAATRPSPVNRMMAAFAEDFRDDVDINLGVGYVNERTIPEEQLLEAMAAVVAAPERYRQAFNYGGPQGSGTLIRELRRFLVEHEKGFLTEAVLDRNQIVIGPSGATSLLDALADIFAPGIVVTADPMYYIYCNHLERKGFRVVTVPEGVDGLSPDAVEERLVSLGDAVRELRFLYVVTVNNPTCSLLSNANKRGLVELVARWSDRLGCRIPVFFDQAYEWLIHDSGAAMPESALHWDSDGLAYEIGTLSKVIAPALRVGFMIGASGPLMDAVIQKTSDVGFSAPLMNQEIAAYMLQHHMHCQLGRVTAGYRSKAARVLSAIREKLGPYLEAISGGQAGFYFYLTFKNLRTDEGSALFRHLSRTTGDAEIDGPVGNPHPRIIYLPGAFCVHPEGVSAEVGMRQMRLSYGFEDVEVIVRAIDLIGDAIRHISATPHDDVGCLINETR